MWTHNNIVQLDILLPSPSYVVYNSVSLVHLLCCYIEAYILWVGSHVARIKPRHCLCAQYVFIVIHCLIGLVGGGGGHHGSLGVLATLLAFRFRPWFVQMTVVRPCVWITGSSSSGSDDRY